MSDEAFADLKQAMKDVLAFERGERRDLRPLEFIVRVRRGRHHLSALPASGASKQRAR